MWNPFLTADERASIRRGGELHRESDPKAYWLGRAYIWLSIIGCALILGFLLINGAYVNCAVLIAVWSAVWILSCWGAAWSIRRY